MCLERPPFHGEIPTNHRKIEIFCKMSEAELDLERRLVDLIDRISVPLGYNLSIVDEVKRALRLGMSKTRWPISDIKLGGSYQRDTATRNKLDVDMVVLVENFNLDENSNMTFDEIRCKFQEALLKDTRLHDVDMTDFKIVPNGLATKFTYKEVNFDLVPAPALPANPRKNPIQIAVERRITCTNCRYYAGLLVEASNEFARQKSTRAKNFCKLAKLWQQNLTFPQHVNGRSYFFECIAMKVAIGMEKTATNPNGERTFYLTCLKRFLTEVNNLRQVKVTFNPGFLDSCYNVSLPDIDEVRSSQSEYPLSDSSDDAFAIWIKPTGSVRPPEEPWKDLLSEIPYDFIELTQNAANKTLTHLESALVEFSDFQSIFLEEVSINPLWSLFHPKPAIHDVESIPWYTSFVVAIGHNSDEKILPTFEVNKKKVRTNPLKTIVKEVSSAVSFLESSDSYSKELEHYIKRMFGENHVEDLIYAHKVDNGYPIVITVPLPESNKLIKIGFKEANDCDKLYYCMAYRYGWIVILILLVSFVAFHGTKY